MSDSDGGGPQGPPPELSELVRRDVRVFAVGSVLALVALGLIGLGSAGVIDARTAAAWAVVIGMLVAVGSVAWWMAGPRELRRERYMVLTPASLAALPVLAGLHRLATALRRWCSPQRSGSAPRSPSGSPTPSAAVANLPRR